MKEGVTLDRWWIDKSVESEVGPGKVELETDLPEGMTRLDHLIKISENPTEMFKSVIDPLNANVLQVQAMLQGGITISQQYEQMVNFMTKVLAEMGEMRKENAELKARLDAVAAEMPEAFGEDVSEPCTFKPFKIKLKTGAQYVAMVPRRLSAPMLEEVTKQMAALLAQGVIRPSDSPWAFPLVLVRRPGSEKVRCCVDYRLLNSMTEPYPYGMQDLHGTLDALAGKKYYCMIDGRLGLYSWNPRSERNGERRARERKQLN
jgi:hypothetical protein